MFWVVFFFPGTPGYPLPLENPPSRTEVAGMPGCRAAGRAGGAAGPFRSGRPRWCFCSRRPLGKAGDRRPSAGGGVRRRAGGSGAASEGTSPGI